MFWALDEKNYCIYATENTDRDKKYFCPICHGEVRVRAGSLNAPHFAHINNCTDDWNYEPMSEWHIAWQELFPKSNREVVVVHPETGEKHRADVGVYKTVIEFQHSPISKEEFWRRNRFYVSAGYKVIWIFDVIDMYSEGRMYYYDEWERYSDRGAKYRWKHPWRFLGGFLPQKEKNIDIFINIALLEDDAKDEEAAGYIERVSWVAPDFEPTWGCFFTSYEVINHFELMVWLKKRYKQLV